MTGISKSTNEYERKQRALLTDRIVKRHIYITSKGMIKYADITEDMIYDTRARISAKRKRRAKAKERMGNVAGESCKVYFPICASCGRIFIARAKTTVVCSNECRNKRDRFLSHETTRKNKVLASRSCSECGEPFIPEYGSKRRNFCSDKCMKKHSRRNGKHIRHERFKVSFRERVYKMQIYRRDGYRCQICKGKVNIKAKVPNPLAPTLDHIIAIANGGTHEPSNVRLAHFMCNSLKSDGVSNGGDQLLLFG